MAWCGCGAVRMSLEKEEFVIAHENEDDDWDLAV